MQPRNMLCPCGSGKRFKHCHGQLTSDGPSNDRHRRLRYRRYTKGRHDGARLVSARACRRCDGRWKELHFFDNEEHFCTEPPNYAAYHASFAARMPSQLSGEATPSYMFWVPAAARMARYNPALKVIILLRNPITRAYSHWNKQWQQGRETLPFFEALRAEAERAQSALPLQARDTSYMERGFYSGQLQR